jgi:hypothetical protein
MAYRIHSSHTSRDQLHRIWLQDGVTSAFHTENLRPELSEYFLPRRPEVIRTAHGLSLMDVNVVTRCAIKWCRKGGVLDAPWTALSTPVSFVLVLE